MQELKSDLKNSKSFKEKLLDGAGLDDSQIIKMQDLYLNQNDPSMQYAKTESIELKMGANVVTFAKEIKKNDIENVVNDFN